MSGTPGGNSNLTDLGGARYVFTLDISSLAVNVNSAEQVVQQATNRIVAILQTIDPAAKLATAGIKDLDQAVRLTLTGAGSLGTRMGTLNTRLAGVGQGGNAAGNALLQVNSAAQAAQQSANATAATIGALNQSLQQTASAARQAGSGLLTMQQQAQGAQASASRATMAASATSSGGFGTSLGGALMGGVGVGAGFGTAQLAIQGVTAAIREARESVIDYNATIETATARIHAFTGSQQATNEALALARQQFLAGRGTYTDLLESIGDLTPLARVANVAVGDLLKTAQLLAAADPVQGLRGAGIALREAMSGNFRSLSQRFEIPMATINQLKSEGVPNIEIVNQALAKMGITEAVLTEQSQTWDAQQRILTDGLKQLGAEAGKPIFDGLEAALKRLNASMTQGSSAQTLAANIAVFLSTLGTMLDAAAHGLASLQDAATVAALAIRKTILDAMAAVFEELGKLPGGLGQRYAQEAQMLRTEAEKTGKSLQTAGQRWIADLDATAASWAQASSAKWAEAGQASAEGIKTGLSAANVPARYNDLGAAAARALIEGMNKEQLGALSTIDSALDGLVYGAAAKKGYDPTGMLTNIRDLLPGLIAGNEEARASFERLVPPEVYTSVMRMIGVVNDVTAAESALTTAAQAVADAQERQRQVQDDATAAIRAANDAVQTARDLAQSHAAAYDQRIQSLRDAADAEKQQAQDERERRQAAIQGLQDEAEATKAAQAERMRGIDAEVQAAQQAQAAAQTALNQHAALLAAIEQGRADQYLAEVGQIDAVSQRLYDRYAREMSLLLEVKRARDNAARAGRDQTDARVLQYEEAIHAAYNRGDIQQAQLLSRNEERYKSQADFQNRLLDQRAKVAGNAVNAEQGQLQRAGQDQSAEDRGAEANARRALQAVQDRKAAQAEADRVANQAQADRIKAAQAADKAATQAATDHQRIVDAEIRAVESEKRSVARADKQAIDDATEHARIVKDEWDSRIKAAQEATRQLQLAEKGARDLVTADKDRLSTLQLQTKELERQAKLHKDMLINTYTGGQPSAVGGARDQYESNQTTQVQSLPQPQGAKAGGGPVRAGGMYTVGEFGAEAFVPSVPGYILPTDMLAALSFGAPRIPGQPGNQSQRTIVQSPVSVSFPNLTIREEADIDRIGATIARTMLDAQAMAGRQGMPSPGMIGG